MYYTIYICVLYIIHIIHIKSKKYVFNGSTKTAKFCILKKCEIIWGCLKVGYSIIICPIKWSSIGFLPHS